MLPGVNRERVITGSSLLLVTIALGWLVVRQTSVSAFTLPDGSQLYLRGVTVGSNVPMHFGSGLEKVMGHFPGKVGAKFRRNEWTDESEREALVFWFEFERPPASNSMVEVEFSDPAQRHQFQAASWLPAHTLPNGKVVASCAFPVWPRQDKTLAVQIVLPDPTTQNLDEGERRPLGELKVKNPTP